MKWITNTINPGHKNADTARPPKGMTHRQWVSRFRIGRPKATEHMSVEELEAQGHIGLYEEGS